MEETEKNKWKVTAIVFIVLFILETLLLVWSVYVGVHESNNKVYCSSTCGIKSATAFYYEPVTKICSCYVDKEITYQEVLK